MTPNKTNKLHPYRGGTQTRWLFFDFSQQVCAGYLKRYMPKE
jgi:hypothetical protein